MTIAEVSAQRCGTIADAGANNVVVYPGSVAVGSLVKISISSDTDHVWLQSECAKTAGTATISAFTLDKTVKHTSGLGDSIGVWSALVTGAGTLTVTITGVGYTTSAGTEFTGSFDSTRVETTNSGEGTTQTSQSTGNVTTAGAAALIGVLGIANGAGITFTYPNSTKISESLNGTAHQVGNSSFAITGSGSTRDVNWTISAAPTRWLAAVVAYREVVSAAANIPPPAVQQAPLQARQSAMPQRVLAGIAALLPLVIGPTVPQGSGAAGQARVAYRPAVDTIAQQPRPPTITAFINPTPIAPWLPAVQASAVAPWPYAPAVPSRPRVTNGAAAPAAYIAPGVVQQPRPVEWPYVATMLPEPSASQWGIPDSDLIFDRLQPPIPNACAWPYLTAQPADWAPIAQAAVQVPPVVPRQIAAGPWPYAAVQPWPTESAPLIPNLGTQIPRASVAQLAAVSWPYPVALPALPMPIVQAAVQVAPNAVPQIASGAWPYWLAQHELPDTMDLLPSIGVQIPPTPVLQWLTQTPWPTVATLVATPSLAAELVAPTYWTWSIAINPVRQPEWPYAATQLPEPAASRYGQIAGFPAPVQALKVVPAVPWPYVATMQPMRHTTGDVGPVLVLPTWPGGGPTRVGTRTENDTAERIGTRTENDATERIGNATIGKPPRRIG